MRARATAANDAATPAAPPPAGPARLRVAGALTAGTASALRARVREAAGRGRPPLEIDLHAVTALDAAGIAALLDARRVVEAQTGGTLVLRTNGLVCRALKATGTIASFALQTGPGV
jgi:anti-anti-sigma factor